jgi:hypothetical protein
MLFVESEGSEYASMRERSGSDDGITPFEPSQQAALGLATLVAEGGAIDEADAICRAWLGLGSIAPRIPDRDARLARALQLLQASIDRPVRLQSLADALHVSSSWLSQTHPVPDRLAGGLPGVPLALIMREVSQLDESVLSPAQS